MQTKTVNFKLPDATKEQIADIKAATVCTNNTAVVVAAVDLFYRHAVLDEAIGQPLVLVVGEGGVSNLPISPESMRQVMKLIK